ncbi:hypothetical protein KFK09_011203 [Dendrobium nobile]|uniref:Uncharacterized protein n=1 Tax=Dendrobium nobile TaxID=94219 RepID=A0A8T3BF98_DENNO|nr:hypothetical protein KFK09_011203 [Dendrobium nobile]
MDIFTAKDAGLLFNMEEEITINCMQTKGINLQKIKRINSNGLTFYPRRCSSKGNEYKLKKSNAESDNDQGSRGILKKQVRTHINLNIKVIT